MHIRFASIVGLTILLTCGAAEAQRLVAARFERLPAEDGTVFFDVDEQIGAVVGITRLETGLYSVTFDPPFTCDPVVTVTVAGARERIATLRGVDMDRVRIAFRNLSGTRADPGSIHLVAVGCD
jgi:hypothetical protein